MNEETIIDDDEAVIDFSFEKPSADGVIARLTAKEVDSPEQGGVEKDSPGVVTSEEDDPGTEDAAPEGEITSADEPPSDGVTSETPSLDPEGNPVLYAGKYRTVDELEGGYRSSSAESQRLSLTNRELQFQLAQAQQQVATVQSQHPPQWDELNDVQQANYRQAAARKGISPEAVFEADVEFQKHLLQQHAGQVQQHRNHARTQFANHVDSLQDPEYQGDKGSGPLWTELEQSGIDWRGLFDSVSPQGAYQLSTKFAELASERTKLRKENERLKSAQKTISQDARQQGKIEQRESIGTKRRSGTGTARAPGIQMKPPVSKETEAKPKSLAQQLLADERAGRSDNWTVTIG